jgi:hypothetical protein
MDDQPNPSHEPPHREDFDDVREFIAAHESFHDAQPPTPLAILERAVRLGSDSLHGITLQIRRIQGTEPEDAEWWARLWLDCQFLVMVLWRMRQAGVLATQAKIERDRLRRALAQFDAKLPDLKRMRDVAQHFEEYAVDGKGRRHFRSSKKAKIGRRQLEVGSWDVDEAGHLTRYRWLDGVIDFQLATDASWALYREIQAIRDVSRES